MYHCKPFEAGFSYVMVLLLVATIVLAMTAASETIATANQREREAELLFIGQQYKAAIRSYYLNTASGAKQLPRSLDDLVMDKRGLTTAHHLRQKYADPMTADGEWGLVLDAQGGIRGVYSLSNAVALTTRDDAGFTLDPEAAAAKLRTYANWKFVYTPEGGNGQTMPGGVQGGNMDEATDDDAENQGDTSTSAP